MPLSRADAAFLQRFLDDVEWRFAKTYVASYPHEYTVKRLCPPEGHARVIALIEEHGVVEPFYAARRKYLYFGERKLWHMGSPASPDPREPPDVINRTWLDVTRYREEARRLGYEGEALERLVALWPVLLEWARGAAAAGAPVCHKRTRPLRLQELTSRTPAEVASGSEAQPFVSVTSPEPERRHPGPSGPPLALAR